MKRTLTISFAAAVTAAALAMAVASAWQRADAMLDRWLLAGVSCAIVAAVHMLPALVRRSLVVWPVWFFCFLAALYGHAGFFAAAGQSAAEARAANSVQVKSIEQRRQAIEQTLATIKARPVATVAQLLARATVPERVQALTLELEESKRAAQLRDELIRLAPVVSDTAATDPVTARLVAVTGWKPEAVTLAVYVGWAALLEVLGALLWLEALRMPETAAQTPDVASKTAQESAEEEPAALPTDLARLHAAISRGETSERVADIRQFLRCSQTRALQLHRDLKATGLVPAT
jgi:hypothetical protein